MRIWIYCQHVLGLGHFFRTREIANALAHHEVLLITGGKDIPARLEDHVRTIALPGLMMDTDFNGLYSVDPGLPLETVQSRRRDVLMDLLDRQPPDVFLVELYPFGRRAFRFELEPVLDHIRQTGLPCRVLCSIRDILVEKDDVKKYESRVVKALNKWFDGVLVHSDPALTRLDDTFSQISRIQVPVVYTGFVTPLPDPGEVDRIRGKLAPDEGTVLVVASAGGGSVGKKLLKAVARTFPMLTDACRVIMKIYTGPYMAKKDVDEIRSIASGRVFVETFTRDFVSVLAAADLSVSMAGYNTCMNIVAAGTPALVWPFDQNREQRMRAERLAAFAPMTLLSDPDLDPKRLAALIRGRLSAGEKAGPWPSLNLGGAVQTAEWIKDNCS